MELEAEREEKQKQADKRAEVERKVKGLATSVFEIFNPIQTSAFTADRLIRTITIVFGLIALYLWYNQFGLVRLMLSDNNAGWDMSMVEYFLPLILLPIAIILFWFRKRIGWILMAAYLIYSAINVLGLIILTWNTEPLGIFALDNLFPQTSLISQILTAAFFGGTLWCLTKDDVKENFKISRQTAITTIAVTGTLTILFIAPFLLT